MMARHCRLHFVVSVKLRRCILRNTDSLLTDRDFGRDTVSICGQAVDFGRANYVSVKCDTSSSESHVCS